jgi:hypothetical protein
MASRAAHPDNHERGDIHPHRLKIPHVPLCKGVNVMLLLHQRGIDGDFQ